MTCPICTWTAKSRDYRFIFGSKHWRVTLPPNQSLVGTCTVALQRHVGTLASLTNEEMLDFLSIVSRLEKALKLAFGATMFNWSCLMNLAYRESSPNPHVHWWVMPRYNHPVTVGDVTFDDPLFGNPFSHERKREVTERLRDEIIHRILAALPKTQ